MSNRNKKVFLVVAGLLICYLAYNNIAETIGIVTDFYTRSNSIESSSYGKRTLSDLKNELNALNAQLGYTTQNGITNQSRLLDYVSEYCNKRKARISLLPKGNKAEKNGYSIETNIIQLEGDFKEIVELIYEIEQVEKISKVVSADFELKEDWIQKSKRLYATIYFQNIQAQ